MAERVPDFCPLRPGGGTPLLPRGRAFRPGLLPAGLASPIARGRLVLAPGRTSTTLGDRRSRDLAPSARSRSARVLRELAKMLGTKIDNQPSCPVRDGHLLCRNPAVAVVADNSDCFQTNL